MTESKVTFDFIISMYEMYRTPSKDTLKQLNLVVSLYKKDNNNINFFCDTTKHDLNNWKHNLLKRTSEVTCNNYLRHLKVLYKFSYEENLIDVDLFYKFKFVPITQTKKKTISKKDIKEIILYLSKDDNPLKPGWFWITVIKTLFYTGMRRRQLVQLKWQDINFDTKNIHLSGGGSKNKRNWDIPLHTEIYSELFELKNRYLDSLETNKKSDIENLQVFNVTLFNHKYFGNELKRSQISGFFRKLYEKTEIRCSSHRYRHRIATDLVNAQKNINEVRDVQYLLGHADIKTTLAYVERNPHKLRKSLENLVLI